MFKGYLPILILLALIFGFAGITLLFSSLLVKVADAV